MSHASGQQKMVQESMARQATMAKLLSVSGMRQLTSDPGRTDRSVTPTVPSRTAAIELKQLQEEKAQQTKDLLRARREEKARQEDFEEHQIAEMLDLKQQGSSPEFSYDYGDADHIAWRKAARVTPLLRPCYNKSIRKLRHALKPYVKDNIKFDILTTLLIFFSAILMGVEADLWKPGGSMPLWLEICLQICNALFLAEWLLRFIVGGAPWIKEPMNIMLTFSVWAPFMFVALGDQMAILRIIIRLIRLSKFIHTIKNVEGLKVVWLLISGLFASAGTLFWSCLLLVVSVLFFSIIAVDLIGYNSAWTYQPEDSWARKFVHVPDSMMTMSRFMSSDGAMDILEYLMQMSWMQEAVSDPKYESKGQPWIWIFFFGFQALSQYVILNLVTAIICDNSMKIVNEDESTKAAEAQEEKKKQIKELGELFLLLDGDGSGEVDVAEFDSAFDIPALKNKLLLLGLEESELKRLYRALDADGSGSMNVDEFCKGIPELFGQATSYSMLRCKKKAEKAEKLFKKLQRKAGKAHPSVHEVGKSHEEGHKGAQGKDAPENLLQQEISSLQHEVEERLRTLDDKVKDAITSAHRLGAQMSRITVAARNKKK